MDNQLEFYQLEEPGHEQPVWDNHEEDKHVLVPIEDEPISHKLSSIETETSLEFQNFGENDFMPPPPHHHHLASHEEMVDLEPAEFIRVPVKVGPDKTYSVITQEEADEIERQNQDRDSPPMDFNQFDWSSGESDVSDEYDDTNERKGTVIFAYPKLVALI